ncbi:MAG: PPC domain-containing DNA-binding protein [Thermoplasmata archaeon]
METGVEQGRIVVKMRSDEDFLPSLVGVLEEEGFASGLVLSGIGALKDFELGWFDIQERRYVRSRYESSHELLSLQGTVTLESDPPLHVHCSLADVRQKVVGGHLFGGTVSVLAEVAVQVLSEIRLTRELNQQTGLKELKIRKR